MERSVHSLSLTEANKQLKLMGVKSITRRRFYTFALYMETKQGSGVIVVDPPEAAYMTNSYKHVLRAHRLAIDTDTSLYFKLMQAAWVETKRHKFGSLFTTLIPEIEKSRFLKEGWTVWNSS